MKKTLVAGEGYFVFHAKMQDNRVHRHQCGQIVHCHEGLFTTGPGLEAVHTAYLPKNEPHCISDTGSPLFLVLLDPEIRLCRILDRLSQEDQGALLRRISAAFDDDHCPEPQDVWLRLQKVFGAEASDTLDDRIKRIHRMSEEDLLADISLARLAEIACLSESRLQHLYKEQVGIPLKNMILWRRLKNAVRHIFFGEDPSLAAQLAGFSDYPHFSRFFKRYFGFRPKDILKDSRNIQVFIQ